MQQFQGNFAIDGIVFRQQQSCTAMALAQFRFGVVHPSVGSGGHDAVATAEAGGKPEGAALPGPTFDAGFATHQLRDVPRDDQAQPGAAVGARGRGIGLLEGMEQAANLLIGDADAGIGHLEAHQDVVVTVLQQQRTQADGPLVGELDCISGKVQQCLAQAGRIAAQPQWHAVGVDLDGQALGAGLIGDQRADMVEDRSQGEVGVFQHQFARLDLGNVEDVVDDGQQMIGCRVDLAQPVGLGRGRLAAAQQVGEPDDGIHRGADLVAHVGQKTGLGQVGGFGRFLGFGQFESSRQYLLFKLIAMTAQFFPAGRQGIGALGHLIGHVVEIAGQVAQFIVAFDRHARVGNTCRERSGAGLHLFQAAQYQAVHQKPQYQEDSRIGEQAPDQAVDPAVPECCPVAGQRQLDAEDAAQLAQLVAVGIGIIFADALRRGGGIAVAAHAIGLDP